MSWDIFVQDLPPAATSVADIPGDFRPQPLGPRSHILAAILRAAPAADASDPTWVRVHGPDVELEVSLGAADPVRGFAFHVRGGRGAAALIAAVLADLGLRALDPQSESGFFDPRTADASRERWRQFAARAID